MSFKLINAFKRLLKGYDAGLYISENLITPHPFKKINPRNRHERRAERKQNRKS